MKDKKEPEYRLFIIILGILLMLIIPSIMIGFKASWKAIGIYFGVIIFIALVAWLFIYLTIKKKPKIEEVEEKKDYPEDYLIALAKKCIMDYGIQPTNIKVETTDEGMASTEVCNISAKDYWSKNVVNFIVRRKDPAKASLLINPKISQITTALNKLAKKPIQEQIRKTTKMNELLGTTIVEEEPISKETIVEEEKKEEERPKA